MARELWRPARAPLAVCLAGLAACLFLMLPGTPVAAGDESVTLTGEIEVGDFDEDGNVASVAIYDADKGSVLISSEGKGGELLDQVGATAKVTGKLVELGEDDAYSYMIKVASYTIVKPAESEYDQD